MFKRFVSFFRDASHPSPSEPAPSTFGTEASNIQTERDRAAQFEKQVATEKARVRRGM